VEVCANLSALAMLHNRFFSLTSCNIHKRKNTSTMSYHCSVNLVCLSYKSEATFLSLLVAGLLAPTANIDDIISFKIETPFDYSLTV
jgi:hypothetical protein